MITIFHLWIGIVHSFGASSWAWNIVKICWICCLLRPEPSLQFTVSVLPCAEVSLALCPLVKRQSQDFFIHHLHLSFSKFTDKKIKRSNWSHWSKLNADVISDAQTHSLIMNGKIIPHYYQGRQKIYHFTETTPKTQFLPKHPVLITYWMI